MLTGIYLEGDGVGLDLTASNNPVLKGHLELRLQATGIYTGVRDQFVFIFFFPVNLLELLGVLGDPADAIGGEGQAESEGEHGSLHCVEWSKLLKR